MKTENMTTETCGDILLVTGLDRLSATNAMLFKEVTLAQLAAEHRFVDVDATGISFIDSDGLGALIAVQRRLTPRQGRVRLLRPQVMVLQLLELLRMEQVFDIVKH